MTHLISAFILGSPLKLATNVIVADDDDDDDGDPRLVALRNLSDSQDWINNLTINCMATMAISRVGTGKLL